jgi:ATP-dependent RNA helicase DeaD
LPDARTGRAGFRGGPQARALQARHHALPIYGGQSYDRQFWGLKQGAQIVIGTPGRVMDHMRRGTLRLDTVKMVILDEVDVMLNMGFRDDIETDSEGHAQGTADGFLLRHHPAPDPAVDREILARPAEVRIEQKAMTVPTVEQVYYEVDRRYKIELLTRLIDIHDLKLGIIFCNTKRMVDDLVDHLEAQGYMADRLHGDMTQNMRDRVMNKFRKSGLEFLVATDVAARGIDVDDVQVVFNYDLPYDGEDYVHRIGRTGRAGPQRTAISFVSGRELFQIRNIERYTNTRIQRARIPTEAKSRKRAPTCSSTSSARAQERRVQTAGPVHRTVAGRRLHLHRHCVRAFKVAPPPRVPKPSSFPEAATHRTGGSQTTEAPVKPEVEKTYSDEEILASVKPEPRKPVESKPPGKSAPPWVRREHSEEKAVRPPKKSRPPAGDFTRLHMNLGEKMGVVPIDIVNAIAGETGLPGKVVGNVDIRERHLFVDVATDHANAILAKLNRTQIKGHKVKVKAA